MVRMVSSSLAVGPGPLISRGLTERRIFRSSRASGIDNPWSLLGDHPAYRMTATHWQASQSSRPLNSRCQTRPLHVRRRRFFHQRGDRLLGRHHLLAIAAEPAHRDRMALGFLLADDEQGRDFRQRVLADLVVDLL